MIEFLHDSHSGKLEASFGATIHSWTKFLGRELGKRHSAQGAPFATAKTISLGIRPSLAALETKGSINTHALARHAKHTYRLSPQLKAALQRKN